MLIQEYNPAWKENFAAIKEVIQRTLDNSAISIEHIGSTSVPGLASKPIIDIDIVYQEYSEFEKIKNQLFKIGYIHVGDQGIKMREVFKRNNNPSKSHPVLDKIKHHLYACPIESEELKRHILFREYLIKNEKARTDYQLLKYRLAEEANQDRKAYARLKEEKAKAFILTIIEHAKIEISKVSDTSYS